MTSLLFVVLLSLADQAGLWASQDSHEQGRVISVTAFKPGTGQRLNTEKLSLKRAKLKPTGKPVTHLREIRMSWKPGAYPIQKGQVRHEGQRSVFGPAVTIKQGPGFKLEKLETAGKESAR